MVHMVLTSMVCYDTRVCAKSVPFTPARALQSGTRNSSPPPRVAVLQAGLLMGLLLRRSVFLTENGTPSPPTKSFSTKSP